MRFIIAIKLLVSGYQQLLGCEGAVGIWLVIIACYTFGSWVWVTVVGN